MIMEVIFTCVVYLYGRAPLDTKEMEDLGAGDQNNSELVGKSE